MTLTALLASFAVAIPLGVVAAWRRAHAVDTLIAVVLFVLYALPTFWTAMLLSRMVHVSTTAAGAQAIDARVALATVALTVSSLAALSRQQRAAMLEVVRQDYIRTARAKGVSEFRVMVFHALRNALGPTLTLASLQGPALLGGAFVVEDVFGLEGIGYETLRAIAAHDVPWLMAILLFSAVFATLALLGSDVVHGALDPRVRGALRNQGGKGEAFT